MNEPEQSIVLVPRSVSLFALSKDEAAFNGNLSQFHEHRDGEKERRLGGSAFQRLGPLQDVPSQQIAGVCIYIWSFYVRTWLSAA